jgi:hypothetical protein
MKFKHLFVGFGAIGFLVFAPSAFATRVTYGKPSKVVVPLDPSLAAYNDVPNDIASNLKTLTTLSTSHNACSLILSKDIPLNGLHVETDHDGEAENLIPIQFKSLGVVNGDALVNRPTRTLWEMVVLKIDKDGKLALEKRIVTKDVAKTEDGTTTFKWKIPGGADWAVQSFDKVSDFEIYKASKSQVPMACPLTNLIKNDSTMKRILAGTYQPDGITLTGGQNGVFKAVPRNTQESRATTQ